MKSSEVASGIIRRLLITSRGIQVSGMWPVKLSIPIPDRHNFNLSRFLLSVLSPSFYAFKDSNSSWSADGQFIVFIISDQDRGGTNGLYFYNMSYQTGIFVFDWADDMNSKTWSPDGSTIACVNRDYFEGRGMIWLMDPDGTNRKSMRR